MPAVTPDGANVCVAFDPSYAGNSTVYAAGPGGIFAFTFGQDASWDGLDVPGTGMLEGLAVSDRGVLYATSYRQVNTDGSAGGIRRCLDPASAGAGFENVTSGLEAGATLWGLSIKGDRLWSIDTTNNRIMTYIDRLAEPVTLISPENGAEQVGRTGSGNSVVADLEWESLAGATGYIL